MSQVVKDPTNDKQISVTLVAEQKRHSELPPALKFLKPQELKRAGFFFGN